MRPKLSLLLFEAFLFVAGLGLLAIPLFHSTAYGSEGPEERRLLPFIVTSGDKRTCDLPSIKGKLVVIFYESKSAVKKNGPLKDLLKAFFQDQPEEVRRQVVSLPVIDCSHAFYGVRHFWERALIENSRIEGVTIYGDWDGKMGKDMALKEGDSNFMVVDKSGVVRLHLSGKIGPDAYEGIKSLLLRLVTEAG